MKGKVCNLQSAGRSSGAGVGGDVEEGDAAHHHSALVPLITSLCFTASLHNNYAVCSFEGSGPLSSYRAVMDRLWCQQHHSMYRKHWWEPLNGTRADTTVFHLFLPPPPDS